MTIRPLSQIKAEHLFLRIDSEHYQKAFLKNIELVKNWPSGFVRFGDELEEITGGATPLGADYLGEGVRFLRVQNIMQNYIDDSDMVFISPADDRVLSRSRLKTDDVLLTITGVSYGKAAVVTPKFENSNINQHSVRMHLRKNSFRPLFISTFLNASPGKLQSDQNITGVTRPALDYPTIKHFVIPCLSENFQLAIEKEVIEAHQCLSKSSTLISLAEQALLHSLGLDGWQPLELLAYTRRVSETFSAKRLDSEFFHPKYKSLRDFLSENFKLVTFEQIGKVTKGITVPYSEDGIVPIIRSGDLTDLGDDDKFFRAVSGSHIFKLHRGDVLISSIGFGSIVKVQVFDKKGDFGTVSEVTIIRQKRLNPYYLYFYLRSIAGQLQIERFITGATGQLHLYPKDVAKFFVPLVPDKEQDKLEELAKAAVVARAEAKEILERAKRAVEIAIENDEAVAIEFLNCEGRI